MLTKLRKIASKYLESVKADLNDDQVTLRQLPIAMPTQTLMKFKNTTIPSLHIHDTHIDEKQKTISARTQFLQN